MEKLIVHPAELEEFRWYICANPMMSHFQDVRTQLSRYIRAYEATESSKPAPLILVDSRKFMMEPSEGGGNAGGALRYQCDSDEPDDSGF